jgi:dephospho-CoA kinase
MNSKPVVGLVGGIGSGKSQAAAAFAARGAAIVSGDALAHEALRQPAIRAAVTERWGPEMLDEAGEIRRRKLAGIVFRDAGERRALEGIVHPWIRRRILEEVQAGQANPAVAVVVLDAAIMLEAGWGQLCDRLVFVEAPADLRKRRVAGQRGWSEQDLRAREAAQLPLTQKRVQADHVLDNSTTLDHLQRQVDDLLCRWGVVPERSPPPATGPSSLAEPPKTRKSAEG